MIKTKEGVHQYGCSKPGRVYRMKFIYMLIHITLSSTTAPPNVTSATKCWGFYHQMLQFLHSNQFTLLRSQQYKYYYRLPLEVYRSSVSGSSSADIRMNFDIRIRIRNISCVCHAMMRISKIIKE